MKQKSLFGSLVLKKSIGEYSPKQSTNPSDSNLKVENDIEPNIMNGAFKFVKKP